MWHWFPWQPGWRAVWVSLWSDKHTTHASEQPWNQGRNADIYSLSRNKAVLRSFWKRQRPLQILRDTETRLWWLSMDLALTLMACFARALDSVSAHLMLSGQNFFFCFFMFAWYWICSAFFYWNRKYPFCRSSECTTVEIWCHKGHQQLSETSDIILNWLSAVHVSSKCVEGRTRQQQCMCFSFSFFSRRL